VLGLIAQGMQTASEKVEPLANYKPTDLDLHSLVVQ